MSDLKYLAIVLSLLLAACSAEGTYPISGEECGPDDPVLSLSPANCAPQ